MSQQEVYALLEKENAWLNTMTIVKMIGLTRNAVRRALNQLYKYGEVEREIVQKRNVLGGDLWKAK